MVQFTSFGYTQVDWYLLGGSGIIQTNDDRKSPIFHPFVNGYRILRTDISTKELTNDDPYVQIKFVRFINSPINDINILYQNIVNINMTWNDYNDPYALQFRLNIQQQGEFPRFNIVFYINEDTDNIITLTGTIY